MTEHILYMYTSLRMYIADSGMGVFAGGDANANKHCWYKSKHTWNILYTLEIIEQSSIHVEASA